MQWAFSYDLSFWTSCNTLFLPSTSFFLIFFFFKFSSRHGKIYFQWDTHSLQLHTFLSNCDAIIRHYHSSMVCIPMAAFLMQPHLCSVELSSKKETQMIAFSAGLYNRISQKFTEMNKENNNIFSSAFTKLSACHLYFRRGYRIEDKGSFCLIYSSAECAFSSCIYTEENILRSRKE